MAEGKKTVKAKEVLLDITSGLSEAQLMTKYGLSANGLRSVRNQLLAAGYLTTGENGTQGVPRFLIKEMSARVDPGRAVDRAIPKRDAEEIVPASPQENSNADPIPSRNFDQCASEPNSTKARGSQCPSCGMTQPQEFNECPRCGVILAKYLDMQSRAQRQRDVEQEARETDSTTSLSRQKSPSLSLTNTPDAFRKLTKLTVKTKAIVLTGLAGILIVGLIISKSDVFQIHAMRHDQPESAGQETAGLVQKRYESKPLPHKVMGYSEEELSKMVKTSVTVGLPGIAADGDPVQESQVRQMFGTKMPPLLEVVESIVAATYECDGMDTGSSYVLADYLNYKYKAEGLDYNSEADKSRVVGMLISREAKLNKKLQQLPSECKKACRGLVKLVDDAMLSARDQGANYRKSEVQIMTSE